jgi:hypothetical protein
MVPIKFQTFKIMVKKGVTLKILEILETVTSLVKIMNL